MAAKQAVEKAKSKRVFGQARPGGTRPAKTFRAGLYARVSTSDQQTVPLQIRALRDYAVRRGWTITLQVKEVGSGASQRQLREKLLEAARRREIDVVLVWRLDRWGRSVADLLATLQELEHLGVGFRFPDGGAGSDDAGRTGDGGAAGRVRRVRARHPPRTRASRLGACPAERQAAGPAHHRWTPRQAKYESCIEPASAKPRSPAACRSAAPRCAAC